MTSFATKVYALAARIPRGKVATYAQLARGAGVARAARAVGQLMSGNKDTAKVPCHRVVSSDGSLTGYAMGGLAAKKKKLIAEGVRFSGNRVDLSESLWKIHKFRNI